ncbi:MAG: response regulator, partial [Acidimicrobiales bacterium]
DFTTPEHTTAAALMTGLRGPNAMTGLRGPNAMTGLRGPNAMTGLRGPNALTRAAPRPATAPSLAALPGRDGSAVILVVDDDETFVGLARSLLEREGHHVVTAADGETALAAVDEHRPDLIVLDIEMPDMSGFEVLSRLRPRVGVPVMVVSGQEGESERVLALDLGADDFVLKPFLMREFAARVRAALRRSRQAQEVTIRFGVLEIRLGAREVAVGGETVTLSRREFDLLAYMAARPGQVFTREQLLQDVWRSRTAWQDTATVTEHIRRVRKKIEPDPASPRWIRAVRNVGYRFEAE